MCCCCLTCFINWHTVLCLQLIHDLTVHSLAEEEVLYPEFTKHMGSRVRPYNCIILTSPDAPGGNNQTAVPCQQHTQMHSCHSGKQQLLVVLQLLQHMHKRHTCTP